MNATRTRTGCVRTTRGITQVSTPSETAHVTSLKNGVPLVIAPPSGARTVSTTFVATTALSLRTSTITVPASRGASGSGSSENSVTSDGSATTSVVSVAVLFAGFRSLRNPLIVAVKVCVPG